MSKMKQNKQMSQIAFTFKLWICYWIILLVVDADCRVSTNKFEHLLTEVCKLE